MTEPLEPRRSTRARRETAHKRAREESPSPISPQKVKKEKQSPPKPKPKPKSKQLTPPAPKVVRRPLPYEVVAGEPIPTIPKPWYDHGQEHQSLAESAVLEASLQRSRRKWIVDGIFDKHWTRSGYRKKHTPTTKEEEEKEQLKKERMHRVGPASMIIGPHILDVTVFIIKGKDAAKEVEKGAKKAAKTQAGAQASASPKSSHSESIPQGPLATDKSSSLPAPPPASKSQHGITASPTAPVATYPHDTSQRSNQNASDHAQSYSSSAMTSPRQTSAPAPVSKQSLPAQSSRLSITQTSESAPANSEPSRQEATSGLPKMLADAPKHEPVKDSQSTQIRPETHEPTPGTDSASSPTPQATQAPSSNLHASQKADRTSRPNGQATSDRDSSGPKPWSAPPARPIMSSQIAEIPPFRHGNKTSAKAPAKSTQRHKDPSSRSGGSSASKSKAAPDPVIHLLAQRAAADANLKAIMVIVAANKANEQQVKFFQRQIAEVTEELAARNRAEPQLRQQTHHHHIPPSSKHIAAIPPYNKSQSPNNQSVSFQKNVSANPYAGIKYNSPQHPPRPRELQPARPPAPKPRPAKPPPGPPVVRAVLLEFTRFSTDRYCFTKDAIVELLPSKTELIASFLVVKKGNEAEDTTLYEPNTEYYECVTVQFTAEDPKTLEVFQLNAPPTEEVAKRMEEVMKTRKPADAVHVALTLPIRPSIGDVL